MEFEILNTIKFIVYIVIAGGVFYNLPKILPDSVKKSKYLSWKYFFLGVIIVGGVTHQQFYTLTEKQDKIKTQYGMLKQGSSNKTLNNYLTEVPDVNKIPTKQQNEELLKEQHMKSLKLAKQIETEQENR